MADPQQLSQQDLADLIQVREALKAKGDSRAQKVDSLIQGQIGKMREAIPKEESKLSRFAGAAWDFGPVGMIKSMIPESQATPTASGAFRTAIKQSLLGPAAPIVAPIVEMIPPILEAGRFYSGLDPRSPTYQQKGTITEPGVGAAIKEALPEISGAIAGLTLDELLFRAGPPIIKSLPSAAKATIRGTGKAVAATGRAVEAHPYLAGGPVGAAVIGKTVGHPYVGYIAGAAAARPIGRWMQRIGARLAEAFPGQVDPILGPVPGTDAFKVAAADVLEKGSKALAAPPETKLLGEGDVARFHPSVLAEGTVSEGQKAGGMMLREPTRIRPEYAPRAQALTQEILPPKSRAEAFRTHASHAIPTLNAYADAAGVEIKGVESLQKTLADAMDHEWAQQQSKFVAPIASVKTSVAGIADEIGSSFDSLSVSQNKELASTLAATKKHYVGFKKISVGSLAERVTALNKELRTYLSSAVRQVKEAERQALLPRLYSAFNRNLPPELMDQAILSRKRYGSLRELQRDIRNAYGESIRKGGTIASKIDKSVAQDEMIRRIFEHQPTAKPPAPAGPSGVATQRLNKQMGITPAMEKQAAAGQQPVAGLKPTVSAPTPAAVPGVAAKASRASAETGSALTKLSLEELREVQKNTHDTASAGLISPDKFFELTEKIQEQIDRKMGIKPTTISDKFAEQATEEEAMSGKGTVLVQPKSARVTAARRQAIRTEAAGQQEKQLGGGRRVKKPPTGDASF